MALQNRVTPDGAICAYAARGTFMGNRGGVLHNQDREIVRPYASRRWLICLLEFKGIRRSVMSLGRYTELFFLDEAVALAAGHRPCAECRRGRFNAFRDAWNSSRQRSAGHFVSADRIDAELHHARINSRKAKITFESSLGALPDGCFVQWEGASYLLLGDALLQWSPEGYVRKRPRARDTSVVVLTPEPIVRCIRHGYKPEIHRSSLAL
ncbi:MAG: hypothetical protein WA324_29850 [Bryobacteraceae bacterium]